jgi:hypothetical protein
MAEYATVWAAISFLSAAICFSLAVSIYRHAEHNFVVNSAIATALLLALRSVIFTAHALSGSASAGANTRHYLFTNGAYLLQVLVCATVVHFLVLAARRPIDVSHEPVETSDVAAIPRSGLLYWFVSLVIWGSAALAIGEHAYRMFGTRRTNVTGQIRSQQSLFEIPPGIILGFLAVVGICAQMVALYHVYRRSKEGQRKSGFARWLLGLGSVTHIGQDESNSWFLSCMLLMDLSQDRGAQISGQVWVDVMWFLIPVAFILPLMYFKMRFIFFDVIIKRGMFLTLLVATSWIYSYWCLLPLRRVLASEDSTAGIAILLIGSALYTLLCMSFYGCLNGALDRVLFRRADYARLVPEISSAIQQHVEAQSLLECLTGKLKTVMEAESVKFLKPGPDDRCELRADSDFGQEVERQSDTATVAVKAGERRRLPPEARIGGPAGARSSQSQSNAVQGTGILGRGGHLADSPHEGLFPPGPQSPRCGRDGCEIFHTPGE